MANFTLVWTPNITGNVTAQRAFFRQRSVGGAFITVGFIPPNDLSTADVTTTISGLLDNVVYEFRIANICTVGGPSYNSNGIREAIKFACVTPTESHTFDSITITVSGLPIDIIKVRHTLYDSLGITIIEGPIDDVVGAGSSSYTYTTVTASTTYIAKIELIAMVNGVELVSTLGTCQVTSITDAAPVCLAPMDLAVT